MKRLLLGLIVITSLQANAQQKSDAKMKTYVDALMKKMTLDEKIGQLNLLTPGGGVATGAVVSKGCLLYTSPSPRDRTRSRMPSSA